MEKCMDLDSRMGMTPMTIEEMQTVYGGESLWYWIAWGLGNVGYHLEHPTPQTSGQKLMNAALG